MDRRNFLKTVGASFAVGAGALKFVTDQDSTEVSVRIYQSQSITDYLTESNKEKSIYLDTLTSNLPDVFETISSDLDVTVSKGTDDVPTQSFFNTIYNPITRVKQLYSWMIYAELARDIEPVTESNLLLLPMPEDDIFTASSGYGMIDVLPSCVPLYNNYSVAWIDPEYIESDVLVYVATHEIGHNFGLTHSYGANIGESNSVMLTSRYAHNHSTNTFGEEIQDTAHRTAEFNPDVLQSHLTVGQTD